MMESKYLPTGAADDPNAPYNETDVPEKEVEVLVEVILHKTTKLKVDDYDVLMQKDDDGQYWPHYDFKCCNLKLAAAQQLELPSDLDEWELTSYDAILTENN